MKKKIINVKFEIEKLMKECNVASTLTVDDLNRFYNLINSLIKKKKYIYEDAAINLIVACIEYIIFTSDAKDCTVNNILAMLKLGVIDENDAAIEAPLFLMLKAYAVKHPESNVSYIINMVHFANRRDMMYCAFSILKKYAFLNQKSEENIGDENDSKKARETIIELRNSDKKDEYKAAVINYLEKYISKCIVKKVSKCSNNGVLNIECFDDYKQDCILAVLENIEKYNPEISSPEVFFKEYIENAIKVNYKKTNMDSDYYKNILEELDLYIENLEPAIINNTQTNSRN